MATATAIPDWVVFPEADWLRLSPAEAGFRQPEFDDAVRAHPPTPSTFWGERHAPGDVAAVLTRGGYLVQAWGRTKDYRHQTASVGKAFTLAALGLAVERLGLDVDAPVCQTWTGAGELSHPHKQLDAGLHREITWRHLAEHTAGFAIESGFHWRRKLIPEQAWIREKWTGDPEFDMYSFRGPGPRFYSSGNSVRLGQALTALWNRDLKELLDRELFAKMGIPPGRWHWMSLAEVRDAWDLYPDVPGYGEYADPPYVIKGHIVRGGAGWVCMSAEDLARFGLLVATGGIWKGARLLGSEWLMSKSGGNWSTMVGDRHSFVAGARVATAGLPDFLWVPDFQEYRFPPERLDPAVRPQRRGGVSPNAPQRKGKNCL